MGRGWDLRCLCASGYHTHISQQQLSCQTDRTCQQTRKLAMVIMCVNRSSVLTQRSGSDALLLASSEAASSLLQSDMLKIAEKLILQLS